MNSLAQSSKFCPTTKIPKTVLQIGWANHSDILDYTSPFDCFERKQKGGFVKGRFWRMCPRFWGPGISKIIAFFCQGGTAVKNFSRKFSYRGTSAKTTLSTLLFANPRFFKGEPLRLTFPRAKLRRLTFMTQVEVLAKNWAKIWTNISGHFHASLAVQNDLPKFPPKSPPTYHSTL